MGIYKFQIRGESYSRRRLRLLTQEQLEEIREAGKRIPSLLKLIEPCYDEKYFQDGSTKLAVLIRGTETKVAREFLSDLFFKGSLYQRKTVHGSRKVEKKEGQQMLIFPQYFDAEPESVLPVAYVPDNTLIAGDVCSINPDEPLAHALLVSQMFSAWLKEQGRDQEGLYDISKSWKGFPAPEEQQSKELAIWIMMLRKYYEEIMARVIKQGGRYQEHIPAGMREVLNEIDRLVDAMYPGYEKGMDRGAYLRELHTKRSRQEAWAHDLPFHPDVRPAVVPVLLALWDSDTPMEPMEVAKRTGVRRERSVPILQQLMNRGLVRAVNTPKTYIDKNGRYSKRAYEATVDRLEFFRRWIGCWLPDEPEERRRVWEAAQQKAERTMYLPTKEEFQAIQRYWGWESPIPYQELIYRTYDLQIRLKEWLVETEKEKYVPAVTELEMRTEAVRTILSLLRPGEIELLLEGG